MDDKEFLCKLGQKIKVLRTIKGVSQEEVMGSLGIDASYFCKLEKGKANPSILYLRKISEYFGIEINELLDLSLIFK